jgi:hypothetical protein
VLWRPFKVDCAQQAEQRRADSNRPIKLHFFGVTPGQVEAFKKEFVKAMVTSCISFNFVENEHLNNVFAKHEATDLA